MIMHKFVCFNHSSNLDSCEKWITHMLEIEYLLFLKDAFKKWCFVAHLL